MKQLRTLINNLDALVFMLYHKYPPFIPSVYDQDNVKHRDRQNNSTKSEDNLCFTKKRYWNYFHIALLGKSVREQYLNNHPEMQKLFEEMKAEKFEYRDRRADRTALVGDRQRVYSDISKTLNEYQREKTCNSK